MFSVFGPSAASQCVATLEFSSVAPEIDIYVSAARGDTSNEQGMAAMSAMTGLDPENVGLVLRSMIESDEPMADAPLRPTPEVVGHVAVGLATRYYPAYEATCILELFGLLRLLSLALLEHVSGHAERSEMHGNDARILQALDVIPEYGGPKGEIEHMQWIHAQKTTWLERSVATCKNTSH